MGAEPLAAVCELAFAVAKEGVDATPPVDPPAPMRSYLYIAPLPVRAFAVTERVLDENADFRGRVAARATEAEVGRAGLLWLQRTEGWEIEYASLVGATAPTLVSSPFGGADVAVPPPPPPPPPESEVAPVQDIPPLPDPPGGQWPSASQPSPPATAVPANGDAVDPFAPGEIGMPNIEQSDVIPNDPIPNDPIPTEGQPAEPSVSDPPMSEVPMSEVAEPAVAEPAVAEPVAVSPILGDSTLEDELGGLRDLVDRLADERRNVRDSVQNLEVEVQNRRAESHKMTTQLQTIQGNLDLARVAEVGLRDERDQALARVVELEAEQDRLVATKDDATGKLESVEAERDVALGQSASLREERDALEGTRLALEVERNAFGAERDNLRTEQQSLLADNKSYERRLDVAEQARIDLEAQLNDVSSKWQALAVDVERSRAQRAALADQIVQLADEQAVSVSRQHSLFGDLAAQLGQVQAERDSLAERLDLAKQHLQSTKSAADAARQSVVDHLTEAEAAINESDGAIESIDSALSAVGGSVSQLEAVEPLTITPPPADDEAITGEQDLGDLVDFGTDQPDADDPETDQPGSDESSPSGQSAAEAGVLDAFLAGNSGPEAKDESLDAALGSYGMGAEDLSALGSAPDMTASADEGRPLISIPDDIEGDDLAVAKHVAATNDVVILIDGDAAAEMGWAQKSVADRRGFLVQYLDEITASAGAAADVVFDSSVGSAAELPMPKAVRVRISDDTVPRTEFFPQIIEGYPQEWPIAVVTDDPELSAAVASHRVTVLTNLQLLDLFES